MVIDCTLSNLKIPGFPDVTPEFGTKKPDGEPITARENNRNVMMPFTRQRPFPVLENSSTSVIEAHTSFVIQAAGVALALGAGAFIGCQVMVYNHSNGPVAVVWGENEGESVSVKPETDIKLEWSGAAWKAVAEEADTLNGWGAHQGGRDLLAVLGVPTVTEAMAILHEKCNGEGVPDFKDLYIADYLDIPTLIVDGVSYANTRILLSGFNHYKNMYQPAGKQNPKNHILFTFDKIILNRRMNPSNTNTGGYPASELRTFLEGAAGDGSGLFAEGLKSAIGDYLYTVKKYASVKGAMAWNDYTVFPPTALEVGMTLYWDSNGIYPDDEDDTEGLQKKFPIFAVRRTRKRKIGEAPGFDSWWWVSSPYSGSAAFFCDVYYYGISYYNIASSVGGCAPAFCVA